LFPTTCSAAPRKFASVTAFRSRFRSLVFTSLSPSRPPCSALPGYSPDLILPSPEQPLSEFCFPHIASLRHKRDELPDVRPYPGIAPGTMASADFSRFNVAFPPYLPPDPWLASIKPDVPMAAGRSPRVRTATFPSYTRLIYAPALLQCWTLLCFASSSARKRLMRFLFVGPRVCLRLLSAGHRGLPLAFG
jgi:hypothetical protein